jgi:hypothetical protein
MKKVIAAFLIGLMLSVLITVIVSADDDEDRLDLGWYDIEDWEIAVCNQQWGGRRGDPSETSDAQPRALDYYTNDIIVTLQAEKGDPIPFNSSVTGNVYEVSWYVQPVWATVNFEVKIIDFEGNEEVIASSSATMASGFNGYHAIYLDSDHNLTRATIKVIEMNLILSVPFMDSTTKPDATWTQ